AQEGRRPEFPAGATADRGEGLSPGCRDAPGRGAVRSRQRGVPLRPVAGRDEESELDRPGPLQPQGSRAPGQPAGGVLGRGRARSGRAQPPPGGRALRAPRGLAGSLARERRASGADRRCGLPADPGPRRRAEALREGDRNGRSRGRARAPTRRASLAPLPARVTPVLTGLGLAAAAGLNAWVVFLVVNGLALLLPQEFPGTTTSFLTSHGVVTAALVLFLAEFVSDKIPIVDHLWNLAQTLLRPLVGALLVLACVPEASAMERLLLALA